jgi:DNA mismatch repair ATPase MutS
MELAEVRFSPMLHGVLQLVFLWDFQVVRGLERWRTRTGVAVRGWLAALGEVEALAALATLRHDNPDWQFPEILEEGPARMEAASLGHPLLPRARRVSNDVQVGPPGSFLLITGSNMSGKSTLLRAIGLGAVLAQAGAPVCAAAMRLTTVRPHTSMRIHDSLEAGLSFFMAELMRLKAIVEAARAPGAPLLYLLDELLQGTNTAERQIAARTIISHLLERGAIGAVTTHDLALADTPALADAARAVHFTETVEPGPGGGAMTFDYRLRPGLATSANALKLMEMLGLR